VGAPGGQLLDLMYDLLVQAQNALARLLVANREDEDDDQQDIKKEQQEHKPALVVHT